MISGVSIFILYGLSHKKIFWNFLKIHPGYRGKSGPALGGTEYRLMPSACPLIVRQPL